MVVSKQLPGRRKGNHLVVALMKHAKTCKRPHDLVQNAFVGLCRICKLGNAPPSVTELIGNPKFFFLRLMAVGRKIRSAPLFVSEPS